MKFLKKVDGPSRAGSDANVPQDSIANRISKENDRLPEGPDNGSASLGHAVNNVTDGEELEMGSPGGTVSSCNVPTLAFPSISTADFQFNIEKASDIIVEKVEEFVKKLGDARLVLVDLSHKSKILALVRIKATQKNIDSSKFHTFVGDITRLSSEGGLRCNVIANAANWRLKPGGGGVNASIFSAAGAALETATKERAVSLTPGKAVIVPLPSTSPLFSREGVTHVIHVLGPNMNPQRPNCLNNDYIKGCEILREAYSSIFESFASIVRTPKNLSMESYEKQVSGLSDSQNHFEISPMDQFLNSELKFKREGVHESGGNKKWKPLQDELGSNSRNSKNRENNPNSEKNGGSMTKSWGFWAQALYRIAMFPERHKNDVIEISDDVVVLNDLYPKAQKHLVVMARAEDLDCLADVREEHLQLLRTMNTMGLKWAEKFLSEHETLVFRLGYHTAPSMRQLHLHVISQDFDSVHLKNKRHWNSFNSPFFRDSIDVIEEVVKHGKATLKDDDRFLSMELRCHRCRSAHPNIPRLKTHISKCRAPFPAVLLQPGHLVCARTSDGLVQ
ncbi:unnamed protein product [Ilex paraguariensis]|uniref:Macro domain-containing protein n=1 Tax=Ilex paraguariensis TaxID=185542 RepID=A0ABC8TWU2_9AQUA